MPVPKPINLNDAVPAPPAGRSNVRWQADSGDPRNVSAYALIGGVNPQTGTSYEVVANDHGRLLTLSNASAVAVTLPQASTLPSGFWLMVENLGAGAVTITPTTSTIDGAASLVLNQNQGAVIFSDGVNYFTMRGIGGGSGGATRGTSQFTTGTIPTDSYETGSVTVAKSSLLYKVLADDKCRLRLYSTAAGRDADVARPIGTQAAWNVGLLVELVLDESALLSFLMQPPAIVENMDTTPGTAIYYTVNNMVGSSHAFTVTMTRLVLE